MDAVQDGRLLRLVEAVRGRGADPEDRQVERILLVAVVLAVCCTALLLSTARGASGDTPRLPSPCVSSAVDAAQAFAGVLGDYRPVDAAFAEQGCRAG